MNQLLSPQPSTSTLQPTSTASASVSWRTCSSANADEALCLWTDLAQRVGNDSITTHPAWVKCWIKNYGDLVPHRFLIAEAAGQVCGIAMLTQGVGRKTGPFSTNTLHLGTAGEPQLGSICVEYNRLLVAEEYNEIFVSGLVEAVYNNTKWETFCLDGFDAADLAPWIKRFPSAEIRSRESRYCDLEQIRENQGDLLSHLGRSTRSNIRRRLKKLDNIETNWVTSLTEAETIFEDLVQLHQARWNSVGQPGAFASERFYNFQKQLLHRLFPEQRVVIFQVKQNGRTVAGLMLLVDQNRLLDYLSGFESFEAIPSIGLITHYLCMEEALTRRYAAYDFLVGEKQHKANLSTHSNQLCWLSASRPTLKNQTINALRKVKRMVTSLGKKS